MPYHPNHSPLTIFPPPLMPRLLTRDLLTHYFHTADATVVREFAKYPILRGHGETLAGRWITVAVLAVLVALVSHHVVFDIGVRYGWWRDRSKEIFRDLPVHCAHLDVNVVVERTASAGDPAPPQADPTGSLAVRFHIEFGPDDFDLKHNDDPEFGYGSKLNHLRAKILSLARDSSLGKRDPALHTLSEKNVRVFREEVELMEADNETYLCLLGIETGSTITGVVVL